MTESAVLEKATVKPFNPGHRACPGCGLSLAARQVAEAAGPDVVVICSTGCLEVFSTPYPESAWGMPWIHSLFENNSAVASGVEVGLKSLGRKNSTKVIVMGGDGATLDIGFGSLSGMLERGHDILYVCFDNEAYMNTGVQRSGSTPFGANTTTSPVGKAAMAGEDRPKKDAPAIFAAHGIPMSATATVGYWPDIRRKVKKALAIDGPKYLQIHCACPPGWGQLDTQTINIARLAVDTGLYPIIEYENGKLAAVRKIKKKPVEEYLKVQKRYAHLFKSDAGKETIERIQAIADANIAKFGLFDEA